MADDTVCVFNDSSQLLYLIPKDGDPYELEFDVNILDLACHPTQREIMYCITPHETSIREVNIENRSTADLGLELGNYPTCLALTKNEELIVGLSKINEIRIYHKKSTWVLKLFEQIQYTPLSLTVCETSCRIICFLGINGIRFSEDLSLSNIRKRYGNLNEILPSLDGAVDSKGNFLIATSNGNKICVYDGDKNKIINTHMVPTEGRLSCLCQDKDGNCYAGGVFSNEIIKIKF